jgi:hypothetical protein
MIAALTAYAASALAALFMFALVTEGHLLWVRAAALAVLWPLTLGYVASRAFWSSRAGRLPRQRAPRTRAAP